MDDQILNHVRENLRGKSKFFQRLEAVRSDETERLASAVVRVVSDAEQIAKHVIRFFPQYTHHDATHLWNVLHWMEELAKPELEQGKEFSPFDCALAIQSAFLHDLGMVPSDEEYGEVCASLDFNLGLELTDARREGTQRPDSPLGRAFQSHCDGHPLYAELGRLWATRAQDAKIEDWTLFTRIRGQLLADYLRASHANERAAQGYMRIHDWLLKLGGVKEPMQYRGLSIEAPLALLAMSHGQSIDWFAAQLTKPPCSFTSAVNVHAHDLGDEKVHWTQVAWLLRLADIMDFDATRTPNVVFEHLGIDHPTSKEEWNKHLSVSGEPFRREETVVYPVAECPSPRIEKALRQYCGLITEELDGVRRALMKVHKKEDLLCLALPSTAEPCITKRKGDYHYVDFELRLDRNAIIELLMGEALYGEPELALRELVQNALDALQLRDLRDRLHVALEKERPSEAELVQPFEHLRRNEVLAVHVTWGAEENRPFVRVKDNGVGMSEDTIKNYLTRIGKSYYKSSEFSREREWMRRELKGEDAVLAALSPISQFGIGFLSCFMLADRITVRTRAPGNGPGPQAWRVEIEGPHGFLSLYPDENAPRPSGTEITLWLKSALAPFDLTQLVEKLRAELFAINSGTGSKVSARIEENKGIEPAFAIARYVVWPLYPVILKPPCAPCVTLDREMTFLTGHLVPLDPLALQKKATEWEIEPALVGDPVWDQYTWSDVTETGSQARFLVPRTHGQSATPEEWLRFEDSKKGRLSQWMLSAFAETSLPESGRTLVLVHGIRVPGFDPILPFGHGVGSFAVVDLRDKAAPRLRADRQGVTTQGQARCSSELEDFGQRVIAQLRPLSGAEVRWRCHSVDASLSRPTTHEGEASTFPLDEHIPTVRALELMNRAIVQELAVTCNRDGYLRTALDCDLDLNRNLGCDSDGDFALYFDHNLALALALAHERDVTFAPDLNFEFDLAPHFAPDPDFARVPAPIAERWRFLSSTHLVSEALEPDLHHCFAPLSIGGSTSVAQLRLVGPLMLREPRLEDVEPLPSWLSDYDVVAPLTAVPLNSLRRSFPCWNSDRRWRAIFILPFLLGEVPKWRVCGKQIAARAGIPALQLFIPHPDRLRLEFSAGTRDDWSNGSVSALWDIDEGEVLWAEGIHPRDQLRKVGKPMSKIIIAEEVKSRLSGKRPR